MELRSPPLFEVHAGADATVTAFGGWEMPVEFDSIRTEHDAVRESVGKFDVSHMGQIEVTGPDAAALMQRLTTNDVQQLSVGEGQYAAITDEDGVMLDDTVVYRLDTEAFLFIPNAGHDEEMAARWVEFRDAFDLDCTVENTTEEWAMIAVQGPDSEALCLDAGIEVTDIGRFEIATVALDGADCYCARTGYTGEDGFELLAPVAHAESLWRAFDCQPCGLGARDTLRLEQGFLLSGQDFDPESNPRTPYEAGIGFVVDTDTEFVGRDALTEPARDPDEQLVGFSLTERAIPRHGYAIEASDGSTLGAVTSGTQSPTLELPIGLGYVPTTHASEGTEIAVVVRGDRKAGLIRNPPFEQATTDQ